MTEEQRLDYSRRHRRPMIALSLLCGLFLFLGGCGDDNESTAEVAATATAPTAKQSKQPEQPEQKFYDYRLIESHAGVRQWVLDSDEMLKYHGRDDVDLVRVKMDFFKNGDYYSTLLSDSGTANTKTNNVFVWGHVVVTTHDGRRLRTSELDYSNTDGLIRNDVYNVFDRGEDVVTGIGLEATPDLNYIEIKDDVAAEVGDDAAQDAGQEEAP